MHAFEARRDARAEMHAATTRLVAEFAADLPAGAVIAQIARTREELLRIGVRDGLVHAAEAMARQRLSKLIPA